MLLLARGAGLKGCRGLEVVLKDGRRGGKKQERYQGQGEWQAEWLGIPGFKAKRRNDEGRGAGGEQE